MSQGGLHHPPHTPDENLSTVGGQLIAGEVHLEGQRLRHGMRDPATAWKGGEAWPPRAVWRQVRAALAIKPGPNSNVGALWRSCNCV